MFHKILSVRYEFHMVEIFVDNLYFCIIIYLYFSLKSILKKNPFIFKGLKKNKKKSLMLHKYLQRLSVRPSPPLQMRDSKCQMF